MGTNKHELVDYVKTVRPPSPWPFPPGEGTAIDSIGSLIIASRESSRRFLAKTQGTFPLLPGEKAGMRADEHNILNNTHDQEVVPTNLRVCDGIVDQTHG